MILFCLSPNKKKKKFKNLKIIEKIIIFRGKKYKENNKKEE
jgi:hypothetical protein